MNQNLFLSQIKCTSFIIKNKEKDETAAIKYKMKEAGLIQSDLVKLFSTKFRLSEVLNGKKSVTLKRIKKSHQKFGIPAEVLLNYTYSCQKSL